MTVAKPVSPSASPVRGSLDNAGITSSSQAQKGHTNVTGVDKEALWDEFDFLKNLEPPSEWAETILNREYHGRRPVKVVISGAGLSGITTGILINGKVDDVDLSILERHEEAGGVWYKNTYPGVRCDVPSHSYQLSFDPKTDWKSVYAYGKDIKEYWQSRAEKYGIADKIKTRQNILEAKWDQEEGQWHILVEDLTKPDHDKYTVKADFFISSSGTLNEPRYPPTQPGFDKFKGEKFHPINWPKGLSLEGKRVALVGNGATGVQLLPQIAETAAHVDHYTKRGVWIGHSLYGSRVPGYVDYTQDEIDEIQASSEYHKFRKQLDEALLGNYGGSFFGTESYKGLIKELLAIMYIRVGKNMELFKKVVPNYPPGARRLLPAPGYLEALSRPNVEYHLGDIQEFTEKGIIGPDGVEREVDVIIASTGYVRDDGAGVTPNYEIYGQGGYTLRQHFNPPESKLGYSACYLGLAAPHFPNFFYTLSVNSYIYCGTAPFGVELQATYIAKAIRKAQLEDIKSLVPSVRASVQFNRRINEFSKTSCVCRGIDGYYTERDTEGNVRLKGSWPGTMTHALSMLREPRWEDYDYEYLHPDDPYSYFGSGKTWIDDHDGDKTFYLTEPGKVSIRNVHEGWVSLSRSHAPNCSHNADEHLYDGNSSNGVNGTAKSNGTATNGISTKDT